MKDDREPAVERSTTARPAKRVAPRVESAAAEDSAKSARKRANGATDTAAPRKTAAKRVRSTAPKVAPAESAATSETTAKRRSRAPTAKQRTSADQALATSSAGPQPTPEERHRMIERIAYFRAEWRGWTPGAELDDWLHAEREVDAMLSGRREA